MNLIDESISHFKYGVDHDIYKMPVTGYVKVAIAALERRKQQPVIHRKSFWTYRHYCPGCAELLDKEGLNFCNYCGQALDWSGYWEGLKHAKW